MAQETGIDRLAVRDIRAALDRIKERTQHLLATDVRCGILGMSMEGAALAAEMQTAVEQINACAHNVWRAAVDFNEAVTIAESAVTVADEEAGTYAANLSSAVETIGRDGW